MLTEQILSYFLNPLGLLALLAVIPVVILYLTRPQPEKKVMPSMKFFQQKEKRSKLQKALNRLKTNLILIINVSMVLLAALALAGLYLQGTGSENTVIIYDTSASMQGEHAEAVSTVLSEASAENTVIMAGESLEVFEGLNRQAAADIVRENEPGYGRADLASAVQQAQTYDGNLLVLSNLDADESVLDSYRSLGSERGLEQIDYSTENRWGFVEIGEDYVEVRSYHDRGLEIQLTVNSDSETLTLQPGETKRVNIELQEGENTVELPRDDFVADNRAYIYLPGDDSIDVEYQGPENRFIETAVEQMQDVEMSENGDVLILNEEDSDVFSSDRPLILMQGSADHWEASVREQEVELNSPYNIGFESEVYDLNASQTNYSRPANALFMEENRFYYNIEDNEINNRFIYPVLWKNMIYELGEPRNFEALNQDIRFSNRSEPGFYEEGAVNFLDEDQADLEYNQLDSEFPSSTTVENQNQIISLLMLLLLTTETLLILKKGVYQ